MKKTIIAATLFLSIIPNSVSASEYETCDLIKTAAGAAMSMRQAGLPLEDALKTVRELEMSKAIEDYMRSSVLIAYETPVFNTAEYRQQQVQEAQNTALRICLTN